MLVSREKRERERREREREREREEREREREERESKSHWCNLTSALMWNWFLIDLLESVCQIWFTFPKHGNFEPLFSHLGRRQANWRLPRTGLPISSLIWQGALITCHNMLTTSAEIDGNQTCFYPLGLKSENVPSNSLPKLIRLLRAARIWFKAEDDRADSSCASSGTIK